MSRQELTPTDEDFDHMHHALGRPAGAWVTPYRRHFVCEVGGPDARRFEVLGAYWVLAGLINGDRDAVYHVTPHGERQVFAWLALRDARAGRKAWRVSGAGLTTRTVVAPSRSAAKYHVWLEVSDVWPGGFADFLQRTRPAARAA